MSKTAYKSRMLAFEQGYKRLRTAAGEYQKQARVLMDQVTIAERQLCASNEKVVYEVGQMKARCASLEQEKSVAERALRTLRATHTATEATMKSLDSTKITPGKT